MVVFSPFVLLLCTLWELCARFLIYILLFADKKKSIVATRSYAFPSPLFFLLPFQRRCRLLMFGTPYLRVAGGIHCPLGFQLTGFWI